MNYDNGGERGMSARRQFILRGLGALAGVAGASCSRSSAGRNAGGLRWFREPGAKWFTGLTADGTPLAHPHGAGLLGAGCRLAGSAEPISWLGAGAAPRPEGPLGLELRHELRRSTGGEEDLLEAELTVRNTSSREQAVEIAFGTTVQPSSQIARQELYLPLNVAGLSGDGRFDALGRPEFLHDCRQHIGAAPFRCHYLEPAASYPDERLTRALLLAPVLHISHEGAPWRVGLFTSSLDPVRFSTVELGGERRAWQIGHCVKIPANGSHTTRCWLLVHRGDASVAWQAFHRFGHREDFPPIEWLHDFRVHYYDFLSSAAGEHGRRGDGYEANIPHFRRFLVGLATQHGYYPSLGDYIHPDRKRWQAMVNGPVGPAVMSFEKMRARIEATRRTGARAAIYLHPVLFDDATPFFRRMRDSVLVDAEGKLVPFPWKGPDTKGKNWRASLASPEWRAHLLQQAQWIMEILNPDAISIDETFAGIGYDHHPDHPGPTSPHAIDFYRKIRAMVRSFGSEKAVLTSDCSMSGFVLWADGECGDHAYPEYLGKPLYTQAPVRYLAALGNKPWRPCAWQFQRMWEAQMKLARKVGAGVGVSDGWIEFTGLARLPAASERRLLADIAEITASSGALSP
jgi:hypothetical protein